MDDRIRFRKNDFKQAISAIRSIFLVIIASGTISCHKNQEPTPPAPSAPDVDYEELVYQWMVKEQLPNGLLESSTGSNFVSLYDNSLAALAFIAMDDTLKARAVFDFFDSIVNSELLYGTGGFAQFRTRTGVPLSGSGRWLGDNAWFLIALNNYAAKTKSNRYAVMMKSLDTWIRQLQDSDGSLWGGYDPLSGVKINKVTENMLDAFNGLSGYDTIHKNLLKYFFNVRWDKYNKVLVSAPGDRYMYALDNFSWGYCALENFPVGSLDFADKIFLTKHFATSTGAYISGYCIDIDRDHVFLEGTGQMVVAFQKAGLAEKADLYLKEIEKAIISCPNSTMGIPYATNRGSGYGSDLLWEGVDNSACVSSAAWYLFGKLKFDPMAIGYSKNIPAADKFWVEK
jgi:cellulose synthase operon protein B